MVTQSVLHIILMLCLSKLALALAASLARPGCQEKCGEVIIPYPFGIGAGCSIDEDFIITCGNDSKPVINSINNLELLNVSLINGTVRVNNPVISSNCSNRQNVTVVELAGRPFYFSDTKNRFTAMGCNNLALMKGIGSDTSIAGCVSICNGSSGGEVVYPKKKPGESGCHGINCCQTTIPPLRWFVKASLESIDSRSAPEGCKTAFMVDQEWFISNVTDLHAVQAMEYVPVVLDWWTIFNAEPNLSATINGSGVSSFCGSNASISRVGNTSRYRCFCDGGYEGNPYLPQGCQDIDECLDQNLNRCNMTCTNTPGSFYCSCPDGYVSYDTHNCYKLPEIYGKKSRVKAVVIESQD